MAQPSSNDLDFHILEIYIRWWQKEDRLWQQLQLRIVIKHTRTDKTCYFPYYYPQIEMSKFIFYKQYWLSMLPTSALHLYKLSLRLRREEECSVVMMLLQQYAVSSLSAMLIVYPEWLIFYQIFTFQLTQTYQNGKVTVLVYHANTNMFVAYCRKLI